METIPIDLQGRGERQSGVGISKVCPLRLFARALLTLFFHRRLRNLRFVHRFAPSRARCPPRLLLHPHRLSGGAICAPRDQTPPPGTLDQVSRIIPPSGLDVRVIQVKLSQDI